MTSVTILTTDRNLGKKCAYKVVKGNFSGDSNDKDQLVIVKRNIRLRPTQQNEQICHGERSDMRSHRMAARKEISPGMELDIDDSIGDGEPRMKRLKSNPAPSTSHAYGTDSGISGGVQEKDERTVDVYMFTLEGNFALILEKATRCIPNGLIIVPISRDMCTNENEDIVRVLKSILKDETMKRKISEPRIVLVNTQSGTTSDFSGKDTMTNIYSMVGKHQLRECSLSDLQQTICTLLPYIPPCHYTCPVDNYYKDMFVSEADLPTDALFKEKNIIRFEVSTHNKNYVCTRPAYLTARFSQATQCFERYKVEMTMLLSGMKMQSIDERVVLGALAALGLIYHGSGSYVFIRHLLEKFDPHSLHICMSNRPNALRFASNDEVDKFKIVDSCDSAGWTIKEASEWNVRVPDVFLLTKDILEVIMWIDVCIYICEVNTLKTSERKREDLESLRLCLQRCIGSKIKTSICCSFSSKSQEITAGDFIQDNVDTNLHCDWIEANDLKLYYKIDVLALLREWIKPSNEGELKQKLKISMDDAIIAKLSAKFGRDTELFFIEQGVDYPTVNQIKSNNNHNFKMVVHELLTVWRNLDGSNLYTLRKAVERDTEHSAVILISDFDTIVEDFWRDKPRVSLI